MECSSGTYKLHDIQIKKEVLESFELNEEKYDYIKDVKQEPYDQIGFEPVSGVTKIKMEQEVHFTDKYNDPQECQKITEKTYNDDRDVFQTEYGKNPLKVKSVKAVILEVRFDKGQLNCCKICERKFYSKAKFTEHLNDHFGEKPYYCHFCRRSYSELNTFYTHLTIVHKYEQISNSYYQTKNRKPTLMDPKNCNHEGLSLKLKPKSNDLQNNLLNCIICNRAFSSMYDLNTHKTHSLLHRVNIISTLSLK